MIFKRVDAEHIKDFIINIHYAKRMPPIEVAFAAYEDNAISACATFSTPASRFSIEPEPYELNRLVSVDGFCENCLSEFLAFCLRNFPVKPAIIVSYADQNYNHSGYIYQATNWIYNGISPPRNKFFINGKEIHERSVYDKYGTTSIDELKKICDIKTEKQLGKHRYFYLVGSKKWKKKKRQEIESLPYPKGNNIRYKTKDINRQIILDL